MRKSLQDDEANIATFLRDIIGHGATQNSILALKGEEAASLLTVMHIVGPCTYNDHIYLSHFPSDD